MCIIRVLVKVLNSENLEKDHMIADLQLQLNAQKVNIPQS